MGGKCRMLYILLLLAAILLLIAAIALIVFFPVIIKGKIYESAQLVANSTLYEKWMRPQYTIQSHITLFSVENPDEVMNGSIPVVSPIGPFVFDQNQRKKVKEISADRQRIRYRNFRTFHFNPNLSCANCTLKHRIWIPNLIYQKFVEAASVPSQRVASAALLSQTPFLEVEAGELLFHGYKDPFLDQICAIPFMNFLCESILELPERIGLFYGTNASHDGEYIVESGVDGTDLGRIVSWNGAPSVPVEWWGSAESRAINGTDGGLFHPYVTRDERLAVFVSTLCRSLYLTYEKDVIYSGIPAYRFVVTSSVLNNSHPSNHGFCFNNGKSFFPKSVQTSADCLPAGLLDVSRCQKGDPPVVVSFPNFLFAPDQVRESVAGLDEPNEERDQIFVDIEPRLGAVLQAHKRSQINFAMWKGDAISFPVNLERFRNSIVPVAIVREAVYIDSESLEMIKQQLINVETLATSVSIVLIVASCLCFLAVLGLFLYQGRLSPYLRRRSEKISAPGSVPVSNGKFVSAMCQSSI